ncbi:MAG: hypothetical protein HKN04_01035 [Rhodothermaceae bacterium]|nr:hypothetical protein [Rhodothermaceae bacterium]
MRQLQGAERRAMGSIKETLFTADLPAEDAEAMAVLMAVKDEVLTPHGETDA